MKVTRKILKHKINLPANPTLTQIHPTSRKLNDPISGKLLTEHKIYLWIALSVT